ncbi:MAG: hypothetical protein U0289_02885 [Cyclobacteriaceae bacterium]
MESKLLQTTTDIIMSNQNIRFMKTIMLIFGCLVAAGAIAQTKTRDQMDFTVTEVWDLKPKKSTPVPPRLMLLRTLSCCLMEKTLVSGWPTTGVKPNGQ